MAALGLLVLLLLLSSPPLQPSLLPQPDTAESKATIGSLILSSLERATLFLEDRLPDFNLDGMAGFQVLQVQLSAVQEAWAQDPLLQALSQRAGRLAEKLVVLLSRSNSYLQLSSPTYLQAFQPIIQPGFWKLPHAWTHINTSMVYPAFPSEDPFSESYSDLCLAQLLGTRTNDSQPCGYSKFCSDFMTKTGYSGYYLSHQLLYFLFSKMLGCTKGLFSQAQYFMDLFCANMMDLNRRAEAIRYAYPVRDLFMENIMLCGLAGFGDFYKLRWLDAILSWQKPLEGCFGIPAPEDPVSKALQNQQRFLKRVKRREKQFSDGCSVHNTAVAVGAIGGFLYVLVESPLTPGSVLLSTHCRQGQEAPEMAGSTLATPK
ncbi:PREDICTED: UPF0764 protein C16orf89-like [Elephantulus edwardii]|uniref:UPF0764 protein C16orf89-like n=1 Tax=Elephantulus edwardii TaxID=28737 RepID=UPI0003F0B6D4|nr:PREDICTED: UPF0764 protein C16orf89-like [Elephantulus edwardii]